VGKSTTAVKFIAALIAAVALIFAGLTPANATHLRGAVGTLVYDASAKTVTLTSTMVERKDACPTATTTGTLCTYFAFPTITAVTRGSASDAGTKVSVCTGQSTTPVSSYDNWSQPLYNIFTTTYVINVACPNFNTANDFVFDQLGSNRIGGIRNALTNQVIQFQGRIKIDGTNNSKSPVFNSGYMTNVPYTTDPTKFFTTNLNALDGDGHSVTYSLITDQSAALGGYGGSKIPCSDLNTTTGDFRISASLCSAGEDYTKAFSGGTDAAPIFYVLKTKALGANNQYVTRDVLLAFNSSSTDNVPTIARVVPDGSIALNAGQTTTVVYTGSDLDASQNLAWSTNTLPSWATFTTTGTIGTGPRTSTLTLVMTPPVGTNAALKILVSVQDNAAFPLSATNELAVSVGSALLPPGSPTITGATGAGTSAIEATFTPATSGGTATSFACVATTDGGTTVVNGTYVAGPPQKCTFSGLTVGKTYEIVVTASNSSGSASSAPYTPTSVLPNLSVSPSPVRFSIGTFTGPTPYVVTVNNITTGTKTFTSSTSLPSGLTLNPSTGLITGTPTGSASTTAVTLTVSSDGIDPKIASTTFSIVVSSAGPVQQVITFPDLGIIPVQKFASSPSVTATPIVSNGAGVNNSSNTSIHWVPLRAYTNALGGGVVTYTTSSSCAIKQINSTGVWYVGYKPSSTNSWSPKDNLTCVIKADAAAVSGFSAATQVSKTLYINMKTLLSTTNSGSTYPDWSSVVAFTTRTSNNATVAVATPLGAKTVPSLDTFDSGFAAAGNYTNSGGLPLQLAKGVRLNHPIRYTLDKASYAPTYCTLNSSPALPTGISFDVKDCNLSGTAPNPAPSPAQAGPYTINYCNPFGCTAKTFTIEIVEPPKLAQTITFTKPLDVNFNLGSVDATDAMSSSGLTVTLTSTTLGVCTITDQTIVHVAAGTCIVTASQSGNGTFAPATSVTRQYILKDSTHRVPAPIITRVDSTISLDQTLTVFESYGDIFQLTGVTGGAVDRWALLTSTAVAADTPDGLYFNTGTGSLSGSPEASQDRTLYKIRAYNNGDLSFDTIDVWLTIKKLDQTITFPALSGMKATDTVGQGLGATTDSGLPVIYKSATPTICEVVAGTVKAIAGKVGTCSIVATQPGDATTFNAAVSQTRNFTIVAGLQPPKLALTSYYRYIKRTVTPWIRPFDPINLGGELPATNGYSIDVTDGSTPHVNTITGLVFNRDYGVFEDANPTWSGDVTYTIVVTATNAAGSDSKTFTLVIGSKAPQFVTVSTSADVIDLTVGDADLSFSSLSTSDVEGTLVTGVTGSTDSIDAASVGICSIVNGKIHAIKFGDCIINTSYPDDATYAPGFGTKTVKIHEAPTLKVNGTTAVTIEVTSQQQLTESLYALAATGDPGSFTIQDTAGNVIDLSATPLASGGVAKFDDISGAVLGTVAATTGQESFVIVLTNEVGSAQVQITLKYSRASAPNSGGGTTSAPGKVVLKTPAPITTGKKNEKTDVSGDPSGAVLKVITKELPKQILSASIENGSVVLETEASFTGIVEVPVQVTLPSGEIQFTSTMVTVNPQAPTNVVVEEKSTTNTITWNSALGAVTYQVIVNGVVLCTTNENTCTYKGSLAADAKVTVASLGLQKTYSAAVPASVKKAGVSYTLFKTIDNFAKSSSTLTVAMKKILDAAIVKIKKLGFKTLVIEGHADGQAAAASVFSKVSIARANAVKAYLAPKLKSVKMTVKGLGMDIPVASNKTVAGQAKNRRATIFATTN
jgi:outer membrane protein OmpA-like peptidoglycan-associated protein